MSGLSRYWAAIAFGQPVQLTPEQAAHMLNCIRRAVVECGLDVRQAKDLADRILSACPGGRVLFQESPHA